MTLESVGVSLVGANSVRPFSAVFNFDYNMHMVRHDTRHLYKNVGIVLRYLCEFSLYKFSCNRKFWVQNFICSQRANTVRPYILPQDLVFSVTHIVTKYKPFAE